MPPLRIATGTALAFSKGSNRVEVLFHNSIIRNFMFYQDRIETNLSQLFANLENSECFSIISVIILRSTLLLNRNKHIGNHFYVFIISIALNSFSAPCPTAASASLIRTPSWRAKWVQIRHRHIRQPLHHFLQGIRSHHQRWKIGYYSGKNFQHLGKLYGYIHIWVR